MTERDGVPRSTDPNPRTTDDERERAEVVHSMDDETRLHAGGDETDIVQGAGGEVRRPDAAHRGGDVLGNPDVHNPHDHERKSSK
jgi:hypothetical protein